MSLCQSLKLYPLLLIIFIRSAHTSWCLGPFYSNGVSSVIFNISNTVSSWFIPVCLYSYEEGN